MVNALPNGCDMNEITFKKAIKFGLINEVHAWNISGGDPLLHPQFFKFMRILLNELKKFNCGIMIESNGWWIEDESIKSRIKKLLDEPKIFGMQISSNKKYYPNYEWTCNHRKDFESLHHKISFVTDWQGRDTNLKYMGRAKNIMEDSDIKGVPSCLNYVSVALQYHLLDLPSSGNRLKHLIKYMELHRSKLCAPVIDPDGSIKLGEGESCLSIGNVNQPVILNESYSEEIFKSIINFIPCNNCKSLKNLKPEYLEYFNDLRDKVWSK
jgi:hypothetical protein